ncbi:MAG: O-antigen ligase family protein [Solirubrobacteraceae bacterium]
MSTVELRRLGSVDAQGERRRETALVTRAPLVLGAALLLVALYAAFSHGAVQTPAVRTPTEARIQLALAALAAIAGGGWLWTGSLRVSAPRLATGGAGLLAAFAAWSGVTVLWSVAPDQTWIELNRALTYLIVLGLAIAVGASHIRSVELIAKGFLLVALAVTVYALGQKLVPGLRFGGLFDLNQTGPLPRLQEPFGYWNALALFIAMAAPVALALAVDVRARGRWRLVALIAFELMLLTIAFTFSRGGLLALAVGLAAGIALSRTRLRSLMWLGTACAATAIPLIFGLTNHALTSAKISLAQREIAGAKLTGALLASLVVLFVAARTLQRLERRVQISPERGRRIGQLLLGALGVALVSGVLTVALSARGLDGTVSHAWTSFTTTRSASVSDPARLFSADSENRWVWWKEAAGAFSDRPFAGWGAGSFGVVHLLYRRDMLPVEQPHSVPLQLLAETGVVGALLAIGGFALLLASGVSAVRRTAAGPERLLAAALLAAGVAYAIHACYDWDSDIPGVTLPAITLLGVLAGTVRRRPGEGSTNPPAPGPAVRLIALAALTLMLGVFAVSVGLPSLAAGRASSAVTAAAGSSSAQLDSAQVSAQAATALDPLSTAGPKAEATIAVHRGQLESARADLLKAIGRAPSDAQAWEQLAGVELSLGDTAGVVRAAGQILALDPRGGEARILAQLVDRLVVPPAGSATATQTPLSPGR